MQLILQDMKTEIADFDSSVSNICNCKNARTSVLANIFQSHLAKLSTEVPRHFNNTARHVARTLKELTF